jgi:hypothetical protein
MKDITKEETSWLDCKVWRKFKETGASVNDQWGIDRMLKLRWHKDPYGKMHLCSWSDRNHQVVYDFKEKRKNKNLGESIAI